MDPKDWFLLSLAVGNFLLNLWSKKEHAADLGRTFSEKTADLIKRITKKK